mgnify:CR=1 FL=1
MKGLEQKPGDRWGSVSLMVGQFKEADARRKAESKESKPRPKKAKRENGGKKEKMGDGD